MVETTYGCGWSAFLQNDNITHDYGLFTKVLTHFNDG